MAERLNKRNTDAVIRRIRTRQLLRRLQNHALGLLKNQKGEPIEMSPAQVKAAMFLVERTLARAEAQRNVTVTGSVTLEQLLTRAASVLPETDERSLDS